MIVLAGPGAPVLPDTTSGIHGSHRSEYGTVFHIVPPTFCSAVVKLVAMQMQALGVRKTVHSHTVNCGLTEKQIHV